MQTPMSKRSGADGIRLLYVHHNFLHPDAAKYQMRSAGWGIQ